MSVTKILLQSLSTQIHLINETLKLLKKQIEFDSLIASSQRLTNQNLNTNYNIDILDNLESNNDDTKLQFFKTLSNEQLDELYTRRLEKETSW